MQGEVSNGTQDDTGRNSREIQIVRALYAGIVTALIMDITLSFCVFVFLPVVSINILLVYLIILLIVAIGLALLEPATW